MTLRNLLIGGLLIVAIIFCAAPATHADAVFLVTMNTAPLVGHDAGPFTLNFQLTDGGGGASNLVTLSNFQFGGGSAVGSPGVTGGASGNLAATVNLNDSSFLNDFQQEFAPGNQLSFLLTLTTNVEPGGVPDLFTFAILDSTGTELPTLAISPFDVFAQIDISAPLAVQSFCSDPSRTPAGGGDPINICVSVVPQPQAVPEPATLLLLGTGLSGTAAVMRRRRRARNEHCE